MLENIGNTIIRLPMDRLELNLGGRIPSCSRHVRHDAVAILVLGGVEIKNIHNFDETWMTLCHYGTKKIKSGRKTANINTKKP